MSNVSDKALKDIARALADQNRVLDAINTNLLAVAQVLTSKPMTVVQNISIPGEEETDEREPNQDGPAV